MMRLIVSYSIPDPLDIDALARRLTMFLAAGLRATHTPFGNKSLSAIPSGEMR